MSILMTPAYLAATTIPLHHARIGYENLARGAVITASSVAPGSYLQAPASDQTWEWWQATSAHPNPWWGITFTTPTVVNYFAMAAHEVGSAGGTIWIQYDAGAGWVDVADSYLTPTDDSSIMILFEDITCNAIRAIGMGGSFSPRISVMQFGTILEMPRPVKWMGHVPAILNRNFDKRPNVSERGQRLGSSLIRQGLSGQFDVANLGEYWVRSTFDLFIRNCMRYGYFIAWRPDQFPDEVLYGWTDDPIKPVNSQGGVNRLMSVSWGMDCFDWENVTAWSSS